MFYGLGWLLVCFLHTSDSSVQGRDKRSTSTHYNTLVCELETNETLRNTFYADVRQRYGLEDSNNDWYYSRDIDKGGEIPCYGSTGPSNVTWCVYVYNPQYEVTVCLNEKGILSQTEAAKELKMETILYMKMNCDTGSCLGVTAVPYYFQHACAVCVTSDNTASFIEITVQIGSDYLKLVNLAESQRIVLGDSAMLSCSVLFGDTLFGEVTWARNGSRYTPIVEDPFCLGQTCTRDNTRGAAELRMDRVRVYKVNTQQENCTLLSNWISYLFINNVTWNDSGTYSCEAWILSEMSSVRQEVALEIVLRKDEGLTMLPTTVTMREENVNHTSIDSSDGSSLVITVALCTSIAALIIILVLVLLSCMCTRNRKNIEASNPITMSMVSPLYLAAQDKWEFPRERLHIFQNRMLGKGAFGKVMQAQAEGIVHGNLEKDIVAVKTVKDSAPPGESSNLLDELELMKKNKPHNNVINLLGCCTTPGGPICLIIEYAMHGNLKSFLRSCEEAAMTLNHKPLFLRKQSCSDSCSNLSSTKHMLDTKAPNSSQISSISNFNDAQTRYLSHPPPLENQDSVAGLVCITENKRVAHPEGISAQITPPLSHDYLNCKGLIYMEDIQTFALQIAAGLHHLETMEIVHCDLAARNILISEGFVLKISDFGMARDISCKNYYRKCPNGPIPVKWTAPEALEEHLYTFKSDIWSFGIVLWEIFSYGHSPYPNMDIHTWDPFIQYLKNGNRPVIPDGCPLIFQGIMQQCWELQPECRPSPDNLIQAFSANQAYDECEYKQLHHN